MTRDDTQYPNICGKVLHVRTPGPLGYEANVTCSKDADHLGPCGHFGDEWDRANILPGRGLDVCKCGHLRNYHVDEKDEIWDPAHCRFSDSREFYDGCDCAKYEEAQRGKSTSNLDSDTDHVSTVRKTRPKSNAGKSTVLDIGAARTVFASVQAVSPYDMAIGFALCDEVERLRADVTRYRATLQKVAERSLAIPGVREVITSLGEGLSSDG